MENNPHCRVKRYSIKRSWLKAVPEAVAMRTVSDMDREARRGGAMIVDKWYDIDRNMEWRELEYRPQKAVPVGATVTFPLSENA